MQQLAGGEPPPLASCAAFSSALAPDTPNAHASAEAPLLLLAPPFWLPSWPPRPSPARPLAPLLVLSSEPFWQHELQDEINEHSYACIVDKSQQCVSDKGVARGFLLLPKYQCQYDVRVRFKRTPLAAKNHNASFIAPSFSPWEPLRT